MCKSFVTQQLPQQFDVTKADQADLLNRSAKFFKEKETFDMQEFANEVMAQPEVIDSFNSFCSDYQQQRDIRIEDQTGPQLPHLRARQQPVHPQRLRRRDRHELLSAVLQRRAITIRGRKPNTKPIVTGHAKPDAPASGFVSYSRSGLRSEANSRRPNHTIIPGLISPANSDISKFILEFHKKGTIWRSPASLLRDIFLS